MYQHDMPEKKLEEKLWYVVEDCTNEVWINVNTASIYILNHISGINKRVAKKIYNNRPYKSRQDLKKVLSDKVYEQAVWFLRIPESSELLDNTDIHPEQYEFARFIKKDLWNIVNTSEYFEKNKNEILELYKGFTKPTPYLCLLWHITWNYTISYNHQECEKKLYNQ